MLSHSILKGMRGTDLIGYDWNLLSVLHQAVGEMHLCLYSPKEVANTRAACTKNFVLCLYSAKVHEIHGFSLSQIYGPWEFSGIPIKGKSELSTIFTKNQELPSMFSKTELFLGLATHMVLFTKNSNIVPCWKENRGPDLLFIFSKYLDGQQS